MTTDTATRLLSNDELDAVSGGMPDVQVCHGDGVDFLGFHFGWQSCPGGKKIFYATGPGL